KCRRRRPPIYPYQRHACRRAGRCADPHGGCVAVAVGEKGLTRRREGAKKKKSHTKTQRCRPESASQCRDCAERLCGGRLRRQATPARERAIFVSLCESL